MKGYDLLGSTDGVIWVKIMLKSVGKYDFVRYSPKKSKNSTK